VTDFEVLDRLEASQYNKFLSYWVRDSYPRQAGSAMFRAEVLSVRPKPDLADQELRVKVCKVQRIDLSSESIGLNIVMRL
jgi:hypothetical protein